MNLTRNFQKVKNQNLEVELIDKKKIFLNREMREKNHNFLVIKIIYMKIFNDLMIFLLS